MSYQPAPGDRVIVRRTPGNHGRTGVIAGTVREVLTIDGIEGILDFLDDSGKHVYLGSNEQLAAIGVHQTIEPFPTST